MPHLIAKNVSLVFPLLGSDARFPARLAPDNGGARRNKVGGRIIEDDRGRRGVVALENINFDLQPGDRIGLRGHNGAGKSTLLRAMAGIYTPTSGELSIKGRVASLFNLSLGINKEVSGRENIIFRGLMQGLSKRQIEALIPEIEEFSELGDYIHMPMKTYSSGMVMRLLFATAAAFRPDIMLLDEWITAGDPEFRKKVDTRMTEMMDEAQIVVVASHDDARLRKWSNVLFTMDAGRIVSVER